MSADLKTLGERIVEAARMAVGQHLAGTILDEMNQRQWWRAGGAGSGSAGDAGNSHGRTRMSGPASFTDEALPNAGDPSWQSGWFPFADGGPE